MQRTPRRPRCLLGAGAWESTRSHAAFVSGAQLRLGRHHSGTFMTWQLRWSVHGAHGMSKEVNAVRET